MKPTRFYLYVVTILVAFCSIVYELLFSQVLTVIFGGAVVRYSVTIGLYLLFLGLGSFYYERLKAKHDWTFLYVEILLSIIGPLGVFFIIFINSFLPNGIALLLSHLPIVLVGFLSGMELPLLTSLITPLMKNAKMKTGFSYVLGFDYVGSLIGTLVYALILYPFLGLIPTAIILGFINFTVAVGFSYKYSLNKLKKLVLVLWFVYLVAVLFSQSLAGGVTSYYLEETIERSYTSQGFPFASAQVEEVVYTPYQLAYIYHLNLTEGFNNITNYCMNLDDHVQVCDSWAEKYHEGLVDIPMSVVNKTNASVLLIGGGDWIAINYLQKYSPVIDHVDIDKKFIEYAKTNEWLRGYHNDSFNYPKLTTYVEDGYSFVKNVDKKYDLIILDIPGLKDDKLLHLYSMEFYHRLRKVLEEDGIIVLWTYSTKDYVEFNNILLSTMYDAGISFHSPYAAYTEDDYIVEEYYMFSQSQLKDFQAIEPSDVKVNSVFAPNFDMILE